ncbi:MAG: class I SAM-dependent methyltransferase [Alphaproteobacteria bacterium]|nr:class I SAM-dependent methyltransferase [Alphaproteobacteria bacterium]
MKDQFDRIEYSAFIGNDESRGAHYAAVIDALDLKNGNLVSILDIGCGSGDFEVLLANKFPHLNNILAYDPQSVQVSEAKKKSLENVEFVCCSTLHFDRDQKFDFAVSILVLPYAETQEDLNDVFAVASRHLKPCGKFISVTYNPDFDPDEEQILASRNFERLGLNGLGVKFVDPENGGVQFETKAVQHGANSYMAAAHLSGFSKISHDVLYLDKNGARMSSDNGLIARQPYMVLECIK